VYIKCTDNHTICKDCVERGIKVAVGDLDYFRCPDSTLCKIVINDHAVKSIIDNKLFEGYSKVCRYKGLEDVKNIVTCGKCDFTYLNECPGKSESFYCENCNKDYCLSCKNEFHIGMPCNKEIYAEAEELTKKFTVQCCVPLIKYDACNHLTCPQCRKKWCWYCKQPGWHDNVCPLYNNPPEAPDATQISSKIEESLKKIAEENATVKVSELNFDDIIFKLFKSITKCRELVVSIQTYENEYFDPLNDICSNLLYMINTFYIDYDKSVSDIINDKQFSSRIEMAKKNLNTKSDNSYITAYQSQLSECIDNYIINKDTYLNNYSDVKGKSDENLSSTKETLELFINSKQAHVNMITKSNIILDNMENKFFKLYGNAKDANILLKFVDNNIEVYTKKFKERQLYVEEIDSKIKNIKIKLANNIEYLKITVCANNKEFSIIQSLASKDIAILINCIGEYMYIDKISELEKRLEKLENSKSKKIVNK